MKYIIITIICSILLISCVTSSEIRPRKVLIFEMVEFPYHSMDMLDTAQSLISYRIDSVYVILYRRDKKAFLVRYKDGKNQIRHMYVADTILRPNMKKREYIIRFVE